MTEPRVNVNNSPFSLHVNTNVDLNQTVGSDDGLDVNTSVFQTVDPFSLSRLETMIGFTKNLSTNKLIKIRFLMDTGSSHSFIHKSQANCLALPIVDSLTIGIQPFGSPVDSCIRDIVRLEFGSKQSNSLDEFSVKLIAVDSICEQVNSYSLTPKQNLEISDLSLDLSDYEASWEGSLKIDVLIGQDYYHQMVHGPKLYLSSGLVLIPSIGGYILGGLVARSKLNYPETSLINLCTDTYTSTFAKMSLLEEQNTIERFSDLENLGFKKDEMSPVLVKFNETIRRNGDRYSVQLPVKEGYLDKLMTNFPQVFRRLEQGWNKLCRPNQCKLKETYIKIMEEQIEIGVLEEVACLGTAQQIQYQLNLNPRVYDSIATTPDAYVHYLPHFPVQKASDGSYRLVYDAKAKPFKGRLCLNDCLETGPSLINSLVGILVKFRLGKYVCKADIAKAFLQIEVEPQFRDLLRLLWKRNDQVYIYRFARLPFGLTSSPFILAATMKYHLDNSSIDPLLVKRILDSFYVDDLIYSRDSLEDLDQQRILISHSLEQVGMILRKWNTNHPDLRKSFNLQNQSLPEVEPILGLMWNITTDTININGDRIGSKANASPTKRSIYSSVAQVFDPLGLLSPFVFQAKLIVRDMWKDKLNWDDPLPLNYLTRWENWRSNLSYLNDITLPRHIGLEGATFYRLHGFCDASVLGFGAAVYLVAFNNEKVISHLVSSKTRIAPSKISSIPRLELCSALLLVSLVTSIGESIPNVDETHFHTDSADVLYWIKSGSLSQSNDRTNFVGNRLQKILTHSNSNQWHHVDGKSNPADVASRGASLLSLKNNDNWWEGPHFIKERCLKPQTHVDLEVVPRGVSQDTNLVINLIKSVKTLPAGISSLISLEHTNDYNKLIRLTNIVLKIGKLWMHKIRKDRVILEPITNKAKSLRKSSKWRLTDFNSIILMSKIDDFDIFEAELMWIRQVQQDHFPKIISLCQGADDIADCSSRSRIKNQRIFLDKDLWILRVKTRLPYSELDNSTINPIYLPADNKLTHMIVESVHRRILHAGVNQTLTTIRGEFWFSSGRRVVSKVINKCLICRKATGKHFALPPEPDLPDMRVVRSKPFCHVGLDFAGPYKVMQGEEEIKAYVLILTCASSRAVWFVDTEGLSAYDFLLAFKRFVGRRGAPKTITSDNAKTFKCCQKKLSSIYQDKDVRKYFRERQIQWDFYCERAPWHGGFIERVVGLFKSVTKKIIGSTKMSYVEFATVLIEAEGIVNSRPITYNYNSVDEGEPLTPSKILYGYNLTDIPSVRKDGQEEIPEITGTNTLQRYWCLESVKNSMWNRWSREYLTQLSEMHLSDNRKKGVKDVPSPGEVVLLKNEKSPRRKWHLARVLEARENPRDGKVRTCVLLTCNDEGKPTILKRSPCFLVPLELRPTEEERKDLQNNLPSIYKRFSFETNHN